ncbi:MAG TPA: heparan-alpha-glucosaminide N-acetyltransferase domain-containing protein [Syntrophobacter fumaroxidans]|nr:heparan-alpha-glucosaminide N-acetyltransferase domain-containing protein [Syntrophobacter fumaroxidans]
MNSPTTITRLASLDAFRGAVIAGMILVNSPGRWVYTYSQLKHAQWNGWTFADTIFPAFLFVVGVSMVFSFSRRRECEEPAWRLVLQVFRRTSLIFLLGLLLNVMLDFQVSNLRIPGVLQRIAACYFVASLIVLGTGFRGQAVWTLGLLALYWLLMEFYPVPGIGAGVLEPGRNFASYVDSLLLDGHMWSHYRTWDPEGIISTIPAVSSTLFGALTGHFLRSTFSAKAKTAAMLGAGAALPALGRFCSIWLPINKNIWTSSYSIFMAGLSLAGLAVFYWLIDVKDRKRWAIPFEILGTNAITAYMLSMFLLIAARDIDWTFSDGSQVKIRRLCYDWILVQVGNPKAASLLFGVGLLLVTFLPLWLMWRRRWFLKA